MLKIGDKIRRIEGGVSWGPIGFETVVTGINKFSYSDEPSIFYKDSEGGQSNCKESYWELIAEPSIFTEKTVKAIQPGTYKLKDAEIDLRVVGKTEPFHTGQCVNLAFVDGFYSAKNLRELAMVLNDIAAVLES